MGKIERRIITIYIVFWLVVVSLVGSIAVCVYEMQNDIEKQKQAQEAFINYYSQKVQTFEIENATLNGVDVCFLGDSLTEGYNLKDFYPNITTANRGIAGDTTLGLEKRLEVSAYNINPKVVVMLIGGNNLDTMMTNYEIILRKFKINLPQTKIVLVSLTSMGREWARNNDKALQNNAQISQLASEFGFEFVDVFTPLLNGGQEIAPSYTTDGVHLTYAGYTVLTSKIKPVVENFL